MQLVSQCFGDIVAGQVLRNISQCNIPQNGQNRCETSCTKSRTFGNGSCSLSRNDCGRCRVCHTVKCFVQLVPPQCRQNIARQVARNISQCNSAFCLPSNDVRDLQMLHDKVLCDRASDEKERMKDKLKFTSTIKRWKVCYYIIQNVFRLFAVSYLAKRAYQNKIQEKNRLCLL